MRVLLLLGPARLANIAYKIHAARADCDPANRGSELPQALEAYRAGSPIAFGNLRVRQQGLADSTRELAWADIDRIEISVNAIQITKKPASMVWFNLSAVSTPNLALLAALLNTIRDGKA